MMLILGESVTHNQMQRGLCWLHVEKKQGVPVGKVTRRLLPDVTPFSSVTCDSILKGSDDGEMHSEECCFWT